MRPTFIIIGAAKSGTTALHRYLGSHPEVFVSTPKELNFFLEDGNWGRGPEWYEHQFAASRHARARGESSPLYTSFPHQPGVPGRMASVVPEAKLIYVVRHPVDRMLSHYLHRRLHSGERRNVEVVLRSEPQYRASSSYAMQIERYLERFRRDQILIVTSESLRANRSTVLRRVFEHVGVDPGWSGEDLEKEYHVTARDRRGRRFLPPVDRFPGRRLAVMAVPRSIRKPVARLYARMSVRRVRPEQAQISAAVREELEGWFRDDVAKLRGYMQPPFDGWGIA